MFSIRIHSYLLFPAVTKLLLFGLVPFLVLCNRAAKGFNLGSRDDREELSNMREGPRHNLSLT